MTLPSQIAARIVDWCSLVELDIGGGEFRYFATTYDDLDHDGRVWRAAGFVGRIDFPEESSEIAIKDFIVRLTNVAPEFESLSSEKVLGRSIRIWRAFLDANRRVIHTRPRVDGKQNYVKREDGGAGGEAVLALHCIGGMDFLTRQSVRRWDEEHQRDYLISLGLDPATDTGFSRMKDMVDDDPAWHPPV